MKKILLPGLASLILTTVPGALPAQDYDYHPALSDSFTVTLGWMRSSNSFKLRSQGTEINGEDIDFDDRVGVDHNTTFFNGQLKWKFGREKKWSLAGQYFSNDAKGSAELTEDIEWQGLIFREGSFVEAGVKLAVARLFLGRSFVKNDRNDFGLGVGLHNLDLSAYIEGEIKVDDETTDFQRGDASASQPLPNIGGWYNFSPARKWLIHTRVDWIGASIGDYDGHLWNFNAGVNYQAFRHVGFDLYWQYFNLNVNVNKNDWRGGADMTYSGPVVAITGNW